MKATVELKAGAALAAVPCSPSYPEHQKPKSISHLSQAQGEFVDWLQEQGIVLARWHGNELWMDNTPIQKLLAEYHGIDQRKIEAEKDAMLKECRKANAPGERPATGDTR